MSGNTEQPPGPRPANTWALLAFLLTLLIALACLAGIVISITTHHLHPTWRAEEIRTSWLSLVLGPAFLLAVVTLLLAARLRTRPDFARWRNGWMATTALAVSASIGVAVLLGALLAPLSMREYGSNYPGCLGNVKNLALALNMYANDYDTLPAAATWDDALMDYVRNPVVYQCPDAPGERASYAYNDRLSGLRYGRLANPASVVAIFESDRGWNARGGPDLLPYYPRHLKGDYYGFPDGHAKWFARAFKLVPGQREPRWLKAPQDEGVTWEPKVKP